MTVRPVSSSLTKSLRAARAASFAAAQPGYVSSLLHAAQELDSAPYDIALASADRALGQLHGALQTVQEAQSITALLRRQEAVASGQLDSVQASLLDILDAEAGLLPMGSSRDVAEARALHLALGESATGPWSERVLHVHDHLLRGIGERAAGLRKARTWLGVSGATIEEASYVPPAPQEIPLLMGEWQLFLDQPQKLHPLLKLAIGYAQFEIIHPFSEASGRSLRWFLQQFLVSSGLLPTAALQWSEQLRSRSVPLPHASHALRNAHERELWITAFLENLKGASLATCKQICAANDLSNQHRRSIATEFGRVTSQALRVLDALLAQPMLTVKDIISLTATSFPAANELAQRLERSGILVEVTGNARNRRFRYAAYVRSFIPNAVY
jgi:Fic family protein